MKEDNFKLSTFCKKNNLIIRDVMFLLYFSVASLFVISCGNNNSGDFAFLNQYDQNISEISDIPIAINLAHTEDEYIKQFHPAEYEIVSENNQEIHIDINSDYYKNYMSGRRFMAPKDAVLSTDEIEYLTLDLDIVNNTDKKLDINELDIYIEESTPDSDPFVYIRTSDDRSNSISFINGSWFNWQGFTFSYKILRRGEKFDGEYNKRKYISYFDDYTTVDLLPDMEELGYDFEGMLRRGILMLDNNEDGSYNVSYNGDGSLDKGAFKPFEINTIDEFTYEGFATLYGTIEFDNSDKKIDFIAKISLFADGLGAVSYENDRFNVKLKSSGNNYEIRRPYTTVIEPYGAEMVKLIIAAEKSSKHKFYISLKNGNDLNIRTKDIYFHHFFPKNCDKWW